MERGTTYGDLDLWPLADVVSAAVAVQARALDGVKAAGPALVKAIDALAGLLRAGGRMAYAGAGSSGVLAQLDALEMPGTFGIPGHRVPVILAGGPHSLLALDGGAEDDAQAGEAAVDELALGSGDGLIAVTASGSTPFTVARCAGRASAVRVTVGLACARARRCLRAATTRSCSKRRPR